MIRMMTVVFGLFSAGALGLWLEVWQPREACAEQLLLNWFQSLSTKGASNGQSKVDASQFVEGLRILAHVAKRREASVKDQCYPEADE